MKLAKLSLAAVVAVTALSTYASAASLEEAIKGVDFNGFLRFRNYFEKNDSANANSDRQRYSFTGTVVAPVADGFKAGIGATFDNNVYSDDNQNAADNYSGSVMWLKYSEKAFNITAGKMAIATPWTESGFGGTKGNGVVGMYTGVPGWTFAAAAFVSTSGTSLSDQLAAELTANYDNLNATAQKTARDAFAKTVGQENLYAAAAIGAIGPVNLQVWYANMTNAIDYSIFVQADMKMAGFDGKIQANQLKLADNLDIFEDDKGLFWGATAGYTFGDTRIGALYSATDKDQPIYTLDADDDGMIKFGQQLYGQTYNAPDVNTMGLIVSHTMGKFGFEAGYGVATANNAGLNDKDVDITEGYGLISYGYSKNLTFQAYYSVMNSDDQDVIEDNDEIRFEAKYSF